VRKNAELNNLTSITAVKANCFDELKRLAASGELFDIVALDPPPFAKRRRDIRNALRAYKEINLRGLNCLRAGGYLLTCSCSHGISYDSFSGSVVDAACKVGRRLLLIGQQLQPPDHPILFNEPESMYLKSFLFKVF